MFSACTNFIEKKCVLFIKNKSTGHLCESVVQHPSWVNDPAKAMRDCMLAREQELCQGRGVDTSLSGTTAVFALVRKDELVSFFLFFCCFVVLLFIV